MARKVKFVLCLHSHQPVGNFDSVFEQVYEESYFPFLKEFEKFPEFPVCLHYSGPLLEWLEENKPEYLDKLRSFIEKDRAELVGGAFYEPILSLIPSDDRIAQIKYMQNYCKEKFHFAPKGFWLAERVWEQGLVFDLAKAGVKYTMVDHTHFLYAGFNRVPSGYYIAEDRGKFVYLFPLNEKLRYLIPFKPVQDVLDYLKTFLDSPEETAVVVYGDDGEKFGSWPGTYNLIYKEKWLESFIKEALKQDWLEITTFENILNTCPPSGLCYLPDASYREMMQWALYPEEQEKLESLYAQFKDKPEYLKFIRGGTYRNFRKKYFESRIMYSRMIDFSNFASTEREKSFLMKAQCNCAYWHGIFGGIYLPHLRHAVYYNIIEGEKLFKKKSGLGNVKEARDINFDGEKEVILWNDYHKLIFEPHNGGRLVSWDLIPVSVSIQATFTRQKESYHKYVFQGGQNRMTGIHDIPALKEKDLEKYLVYDNYQRVSFCEHFLDTVPNAEDIAFLNFKYNPDFVQRQLDFQICKRETGVDFFERDGKFRKKINLESDTVKVGYENEQVEKARFFAVEFNLFTLSPDAPDKGFWINDNNFMGTAGVFGESEGNKLIFKDEWRGFSLIFSSHSNFFVRIAPLYTVNLSESGIEKVFQNSTVFLIFENNGDKIELDITLKTLGS